MTFTAGGDRSEHGTPTATEVQKLESLQKGPGSPLVDYLIDWEMAFLTELSGCFPPRPAGCHLKT